jgi:DNA-directed RNA polymerase III subunit RPC6
MENEVFNTIQESKNGILTDLLSQKTNLDSTSLLEILNNLAQANKVEFLSTTNNQILIKSIPIEESLKLSKMSVNDKIVYKFIKESCEKGTWLKNIKDKSGLHVKNVVDSIKNLEKEKIIKMVKSVKQPTKKVYMLYELEPDVELTGGSWYTDDTMDIEFIDTLCSMILKFIQKVIIFKTVLYYSIINYIVLS